MDVERVGLIRLLENLGESHEVGSNTDVALRSIVHERNLLAPPALPRVARAGVRDGPRRRAEQHLRISRRRKCHSAIGDSVSFGRGIRRCDQSCGRIDSASGPLGSRGWFRPRQQRDERHEQPGGCRKVRSHLMSIRLARARRRAEVRARASARGPVERANRPEFRGASSLSSLGCAGAICGSSDEQDRGVADVWVPFEAAIGGGW